MASTQPPYHTSTFGNIEHTANSITPGGTSVGNSSVNAPDTTGAEGVHGSSTGAPSTPGTGDRRSQYDPSMSGYNPSTGSGYTPADREHRIPEKESESKSAQKGEQVGRGVKSTVAGIHGAGESLRGALTSAVDKAFGFDESATKGDDIARKGEEQIRTGDFSPRR